MTGNQQSVVKAATLPETPASQQLMIIQVGGYRAVIERLKGVRATDQDFDDLLKLLTGRMDPKRFDELKVAAEQTNDEDT